MTAYYSPTQIQPSKKLADEVEREEESSPMNRCCCCHVTKGTVVVGILELILLIAELAGVIATYVFIEITPNLNSTSTLISTDNDFEAISSLDSGITSPNPTTTAKLPYGLYYGDYNWIYGQSPITVLSVGVGAAVLGITIVILMIIGVKKMKPQLMIPHMIVQVFGILGLFAGSALFIFAAVTVSTSATCAETHQGDACTKILLSFCAFIIVFTFFAGLQIYFFILTIRCYRYISRRRRRLQNMTSPYYALYQQQQRLYQQQMQQQQQQQKRQQTIQQQQHPQQQSPQSDDGQGQIPQQQQQQQMQMPQAAAYMQQPIYATYAQPYGMAGYGYGYRYN